MRHAHRVQTNIPPGDHSWRQVGSREIKGDTSRLYRYHGGVLRGSRLKVGTMDDCGCGGRHCSDSTLPLLAPTGKFHLQLSHVTTQTSSLPFTRFPQLTHNRPACRLRTTSPVPLVPSTVSSSLRICATRHQSHSSTPQLLRQLRLRTLSPRPRPVSRAEQQPAG